MKDGKFSYEDNKNIKEYEILKMHGVVNQKDLFNKGNTK